MFTKKYIVTRTVDIEECPWLDSMKDERVEKGTIVYEYPDFFGCGSPDYGVTVSLKAGKHPYFELPLDALREIFGADFSLN